MIPYWHEQNPWKDELTYVPLDELAECMLHENKSLSRWFQYGDKLDAYILPGNKEITAGVRFGPEGSDYLSPGFNEYKLRILLDKYRNQKKRTKLYLVESTDDIGDNMSAIVEATNANDAVNQWHFWLQEYEGKAYDINEQSPPRSVFELPEKRGKPGYFNWGKPGGIIEHEI